MQYEGTGYWLDLRQNEGGVLCVRGTCVDLPGLVCDKMKGNDARERRGFRIDVRQKEGGATMCHMMDGFYRLGHDGNFIATKRRWGVCFLAFLKTP
jgi:hypothetical protein